MSAVLFEATQLVVALVVLGILAYAISQAFR